MICFPNAKINLGLNILNRRPDGYHNLDTVMIPVNWTDILEIVAADGLCDSLTVTGRVVDCEPEKNLVMKAVKALRTKCDFPAVEIHLHKIIPDGAGLGGGSADAAFTLTTHTQAALQSAAQRCRAVGYCGYTRCRLSGVRDKPGITLHWHRHHPFHN